MAGADPSGDGHAAHYICLVASEARSTSAGTKSKRCEGILQRIEQHHSVVVAARSTSDDGQASGIRRALALYRSELRLGPPL